MPQVRTPMSRERRAELLAAAPPEVVIDLAERCLDAEPDMTVISGPEVGMVMLTVREPIAKHRFHLGEVLVTRAEVEIDRARGWAMRMGDDRIATLACAVLDAVVEADLVLAGDVAELCELVDTAERERRADEWDALSPTEVRFDELD